MRRALLVFTLFATGMAGGNELPDFGSAADAVLSKSRERQIGRGAMLQLRMAGAVLDDPMLTEYISLLGSRLASQANDGEHRFEFFVVNDDRINAFAMPGGFIGINNGLILASENESELAGVLAHEISHVTQRHIARSVYDNQRSSIVSLATMIAALVLGAATDASGDALAGITTASQAAIAQRQLNFTRANEQEADRIGIQVLAAAGFDPGGMSSFFEKLSRRYGSTGQVIPEYLRSHPISGSRVAEARARARNLPRITNVDSFSYGLAKARLLALTPGTGEQAMAVFKPLEESRTPADRYGRALALTRIGLNDNAELIFRDLVAEFPTVTAFRIGQAEALFADGLTEQSMAVYRQALALSPRNVPLTISYAESLIAAGQPAEAHRVLLDLLNNVPPTPAQIQLIARAANAEGDVSAAHNYMAEYYLSIGNLQLAISQLQMALELPDVNAVDRSRFRARLEQIIEYLPDEERGRALSR
ncbi:MAG: M48 family metalloprotease [Gammaproteobacteria bacterium]